MTCEFSKGTIAHTVASRAIVEGIVTMLCKFNHTTQSEWIGGLCYVTYVFQDGSYLNETLS
jgi:hypothetical protein